VTIPQPDGWDFVLDEPVAVTHARPVVKGILYLLGGLVVLAVGLVVAAVVLVGAAIWFAGLVAVGLLTPLSIVGGLAARQGMRSWDEVTR
jgi:hypothetical protein